MGDTFMGAESRSAPASVPGYDTGQGWEPFTLLPSPARLGFADRVSKWVWPVQGTQYGARALNCWWGNQLPNSSTSIPGVTVSLWSNQTSGMVAKNVQLSTGAGGQTRMGTAASVDLMTQAQNAWGAGGQM